MSANSEALAVVGAQSLAKHYTYTPEQLELIKRTVSTTPLTNDEFQIFMYVCKARNLDPLQRQIHCVKRKVWNNDSKQYEERMTIQTGIDGYRAIANRTGLYMPSDREAKIGGEGTEQFHVTMYVKKWSSRDEQWHEFNATAYYREFVQLYKPKDSQKLVPNSMWEKMPVNQLTKCAEALALRKGWPEELGDLRTDEEMAQADSPQRGEVLPAEQAQETRAKGKKSREADLGSLSRSNEPNRGHGNEGLENAPEPPKILDVNNLPSGQDLCGGMLVKGVSKNSRTPGAPQYSIVTFADLEGHETDLFCFNTKMNWDAVKGKPCKYVFGEQPSPEDATTTRFTFEGFVTVDGKATDKYGNIL